MTAAARPLSVVRCAGCADAARRADEAETRLAELEEILSLMSESRNIVETDNPTAHTGTAETGEAGEMTTMEIANEVTADATVRREGDMRLPRKIRAALGVAEGDTLRFKLSADGTVTVKVMRLVEGG